MSEEVWLARRTDSLIATDDESRKEIESLEEGECAAFERASIRDPISYRRYWAIMTSVAKHVKQIEIDRVGKQPVHMWIFGDKKNVHTAMKLCTGLFDVLPVCGTDYAIRVPRSTNFRSMTRKAWGKYWQKVIEVLVERVAPEFDDSAARDDMLISLERWGYEAAA